MGLAIVTGGESADTTIAVGCVLLAGGLFLTVRIPMMRVTLTTDSVAIHGLVKTRRISWDDIADVTMADTAGIVLTARAPALTLEDGEQVVLSHLAGYTTPAREPRSRMARQLDVLRTRLGR
ncbi:hypothetical protein [Cellulomonas sp. URHB0016]